MDKKKGETKRATEQAAAPPALPDPHFAGPAPGNDREGINTFAKNDQTGCTLLLSTVVAPYTTRFPLRGPLGRAGRPICAINNE